MLSYSIRDTNMRFSIVSVPTTVFKYCDINKNVSQRVPPTNLSNYGGGWNKLNDAIVEGVALLYVRVVMIIRIIINWFVKEETTRRLPGNVG